MSGKGHRFYRYEHKTKRGWIAFQVKYRESDLWIRALKNCQKEAYEAVLDCRRQLELYIAKHPRFLHSLHPLPDDPLAPPLVRSMLQAGLQAGVGPMASVAGAIAQSVAQRLKSISPSVVVENGGDCYLDIDEDVTVGIYAGPHSPFSGKIGLHFPKSRFPIGICTSSGTFGHSLSFGKADTVTVVSKDAGIADASATALANLVRKPADIGKALEKAALIPTIEGALILIEDKMGAWGELEILPLDLSKSKSSSSVHQAKKN